MNTPPSQPGRSGFTLSEILIATAISASVIAALLSVYLVCIQSWHRVALVSDATHEGNRCLDRMVYGVGTGMGLRASYSVTNAGTATDWVLRTSNYNGVASYDYIPSRTVILYSNAGVIQILGTNIVSSTVTATVNGVRISLTVGKTDGRLSETNQMTTFVKLRTATMR